MLNQQPEPSPFDGCQSLDELLLIVHRLGGLEAVDKVLTGSGWCRESLREAAAKLGSVGLTGLARLIRAHARRAKPRPPPVWYTEPDPTLRHKLYITQRGARHGRLGLPWRKPAPACTKVKTIAQNN